MGWQVHRQNTGKQCGLQDGAAIRSREGHMEHGEITEGRQMRQLESPTKTFEALFHKIRREWKIAFLACFLLGLLVHMPALLSDIPNHDGLDSMYFDQNMITSGRWFLTVACGISSYYTLPWTIGVLGLVYLGCAAAALCELLEIRRPWAAAACGGLLSVFPAFASTVAYVFTLDGYMLAILLAVLAVLFVKKRRLGFLPGAVCLAFSMGIYQAYLSFAMILSVFSILMLCADGAQGPSPKGKDHGRGAAPKDAPEGKDHGKCAAPKDAPEGKGHGECAAPKDAPEGKGHGKCAAPKDAPWGGKIKAALGYLYMGVLGTALYYGILRVLLLVQGKELAGYQGIDGMVSAGMSGRGILSGVVEMYRDFLGFTFHGNVLFQNIFSAAACVLLTVSGAIGAYFALRERKSWKNPVTFVIMVVAVAALPAATNIILLISPAVTYHLLMRYQWVLYLIGIVALAGNIAGKAPKAGSGESGPPGPILCPGLWAEWAACLGVWALIFCFCITDSIAYSNLQKRYEKTYAYCIRLLDRIEQTEGYYPGIPIAMVGVVGDEQYPPTDITLDVTSNMIGMSGDSLLYRGDNYREFIRNYLGATLNILPAEAMAEMYYSEEYTAMESFPGRDSIRIIDGILYVKTENVTR